jgi:hypothetical protein
MLKHIQIRTARRIITRLARIHKKPLHLREVYLLADTFLQWERQYREAWLLARYDDLTKFIGMADEELAIVLL